MLEINGKKEELIQNIARKYDLRLLFLFGSRVTGRIHKESDFDFGYISSRELSVGEEGLFIYDLMPIAQAGDERLINLVNFKRVKPLLLYSAMVNSQLLYEREANYFDELKLRAFRMYVELMPLLKERAERMGIKLK